MAVLPFLGRLHTIVESSLVDADATSQAQPMLLHLEVYTDFLIFGYHFYGDLLDEGSLPSDALPIWHEALGQIALHRVEVLELQKQCVSLNVPGSGKRSTLEQDTAQRDPPLAGESGGKPKAKAGILRPPAPARVARRTGGRSEQRADDAESPPGNSIGTAALDDWVLHEEDLWRKTAREWFFKAVHVEPGRGALHAFLSLTHTREESLHLEYHRCRR